MHKCYKCGTEFEGAFCPECGEKWEAERQCPKCGKVCDGSLKFCPNCGHAFITVRSSLDKIKTKAKIFRLLPNIVFLLLAVAVILSFLGPVGVDSLGLGVKSSNVFQSIIEVFSGGFMENEIESMLMLIIIVGYGGLAIAILTVLGIVFAIRNIYNSVMNPDGAEKPLVGISIALGIIVIIAISVIYSIHARAYWDVGAGTVCVYLFSSLLLASMIVSTIVRDMFYKQHPEYKPKKKKKGMTAE